MVLLLHANNKSSEFLRVPLLIWLPSFDKNLANPDFNVAKYIHQFTYGNCMVELKIEHSIVFRRYDCSIEFRHQF